MSGHPLRKYSIEYKSFSNYQIGDTEQLEDSQEVKVCGIITGVRTKIDRSNNRMAFFTVDDFSGSCECIMFSKIFEQYGKYIINEEPVYIVGVLESSGDAVKINVKKLLPLEKARNELCSRLNILVDKKSIQPDILKNLKPMLDKNQGKVSVYLRVFENGGKGKLYSLNNRIELTQSIMEELSGLFSEDSITLNF